MPVPLLIEFNVKIRVLNISLISNDENTFLKLDITGHYILHDHVNNATTTADGGNVNLLNDFDQNLPRFMTGPQ